MSLEINSALRASGSKEIQTLGLVSSAVGFSAKGGNSLAKPPMPTREELAISWRYFQIFVLENNLICPPSNLIQTLHRL